MISRRQFVATAASAGTVLGAGDRIRIAVIGAGGRGTALMKELSQCANVEVNAVCDVYNANRERAAALARKTWGAQPFESASYLAVLDRKDVDAVLIATPDFSHPIILKAAVEAGKDVYCEKPMATEFAPARAAYQAVKAARQVVQIGTQRRSDGQFIAASKLIQAGAIGKVTRIDISMNFQEPRWRRDFSGIRESDVDWKQFRMHRPPKPFRAREFREWQLFRDYTNGIAGLWMCHFIDTIAWFMDDPYPAGAVANGGVYLWRDGRETCDVFHALLDYPKGFLVSFAMSLTNSAGTRNLWFGTKGTLDADRWVLSGEGSRESDRVQGQTSIEPVAATSHMQNFIDCIRTRETPRAGIEAGFSHAVACCMASQALDTGRKIRFDRQRLDLV
jgi:predicted dehydrogenase